MARSIRVLVLVVVGSLSLAPSSEASAIILSALRSVEASASASDFPDTPSPSNSTATSGTFSGSRFAIDAYVASFAGGVGQLHGVVTTSSLTASGLTQANGFSIELFPASAMAKTYYDVQFSLLQPHSYLFGGLTTVTGSGGDLSILLMQGGTPIHEINTTSLFSFSGVLQPGDYRFIVSALNSISVPLGSGNAEDAGSIEFNAGLTLTQADPSPVPEPASLSLLAVGLGALGAGRWRRRRKILRP